jgi:phosphoribosyl-dephospho-CoA transferase
MTPKEDAKVMLEQIEHPERFCQVCGKRVGICSHTKGQEA